MKKRFVKATRREPARGVPKKGGRVSCVVHFDEDQFAWARARAVEQGTSFGEQIRLFTEWARETVENEGE